MGKSQILLLECGKRTKYYDQNVISPTLALVAITWSEDEMGIISLADLLREQGLF